MELCTQANILFLLSQSEQLRGPKGSGANGTDYSTSKMQRIHCHFIEVLNLCFMAPPSYEGPLLEETVSMLPFDVN